jgi:hypothetical protein
MPTQTRIVSPGPDDRSVRAQAGELLRPPADWILLPPGDAALTRRVKAAGPTWTVQQRRGRKVFSRGVWAPRAVVAEIRAALDAERSTPQHASRRAADARRRAETQVSYVEDFRRAVVGFLAFDARHAELAARLADAVTAHATPVGSGTVARTQRIPIERRAEAAVIAWMRHQTTAYDQMAIPRIRGKRREVRRLLAQQANVILQAYRQGTAVDRAACPLVRALAAAG